MSNPTTPFSWQMPTATDLVTDLPADFEVFGQAVATSMADLLGGTSGQILAKNSNTDMDFVWIANDQGDITGITASSPITGGGTSGAVTIGILNGTTSNLGAVQLSDSTSSTSTTLAATANAVKSAYDLANAAIPKSLIDAAGDLIVGTAADTAGRLAIGTANQVLRVNSGATALEWATAGGASGLTLVKAQTIGSAVSSIEVTSAFSATYDNYLITVTGGAASADSLDLSIQFGSTTSGYAYSGYYQSTTSSTITAYATNSTSAIGISTASTLGASAEAFISNPYASSRTSVASRGTPLISGDFRTDYAGRLENTTSYTSFKINVAGGTMTGGTIRVYGYQNS